MNKKILLLIVGIVIYSIIIWKIGIGEFLQSIRHISLYSILLFEIILLSMGVLKALRLSILIDKITKSNVLENFRIFYIGQMINQGIMSTSGDLSKMLLIKKTYNLPISKSISPVVTDRAFDLIMILLFSILGANFIALKEYTIILLVPVILLLSIIFVLFVPEKILDKILIFKLKKLKKFFLGFKEGLAIYKGRILFVILILTVVPWLLEAVAFRLLFNDLSISINYFGLLGIICISLLAGFISMIPGGLGARELTIGVLLSFVGVPLYASFAVSTIYRVLVVINDSCMILVMSALRKFKQNL